MNVQSGGSLNCPSKLENAEGVDIEEERFNKIFEKFVTSQKLSVIIAQLTKAAKIINMKLQERKFKDVMNEDFEMTNAESKRTKRNSQYQSMATNIVWYLAYVLHHNKEPDMIRSDDQFVYDNRNKSRYTDSYMDKRINSDWCIEMVRIIKRYMPLLILKFYELYNNKNIELQKTKINKNIDRQLNMYTKLYMAILTELDQEYLHLYIRHMLSNKSYVRITIIEILKCCIDRSIKVICPKKQIETACSTYHDILKNEEFSRINDMMISYAKELKYNKYKPHIEKNDDDIKPIDLRKFPGMNRYNYALYSYTSKEPLELPIETYQTSKQKTYSIIKFIQSSNTHIFDVLSCGNKKLNDISWQERLNLIDQHELTDDYRLINIRPIEYEMIQFNMLTSDNDSNYQYIRTSSLGVGTLFINVGKQAKKNRLTSSINKRHKKVKREDLEPCTESLHLPFSCVTSSNIEDEYNIDNYIPVVQTQSFNEIAHITFLTSNFLSELQKKAGDEECSVSPMNDVEMVDQCATGAEQMVEENRLPKPRRIEHRFKRYTIKPLTGKIKNFKKRANY